VANDLEEDQVPEEQSIGDSAQPAQWNAGHGSVQSGLGAERQRQHEAGGDEEVEDHACGMLSAARDGLYPARER
jgi:hypothetical protein